MCTTIEEQKHIYYKSLVALIFLLQVNTTCFAQRINPQLDSLIENKLIIEATKELQSSLLNKNNAPLDVAYLHLAKAKIKVLNHKDQQALQLLDSLYLHIKDQPSLLLDYYNFQYLALLHSNKIIEADSTVSNYIDAAKRTMDVKHLGKAYYAKARIAEELDKLSDAKSYYLLAYKQFDLLSIVKMQAATYQALGIVARKQHLLDDASDNYLKAAELYRQIDDFKGLSACYSSIGILLASNQSYKLAIQYFKKAIQTISQLNNLIAHPNLAKYCNNIGLSYKKLNELDTALKYLLKAKNLYSALGDAKNQAYNFNNIALVYMNLSHLDSAENYFIKALAVKDSLGLHKSMVESELGLAQTYQKKNDKTKADNYYQSALVKAEKYNNFYLIHDVKDKYARFLFQNGDVNAAYKQLITAKNIKDSLTIKERVRLQAETDARLNIVMQENENTLLNRKLSAEQERLEIKESYLNILRLVVIGLIVLILIAVIQLNMLLKSRKKEVLRQKEMLNANRQLEALNKEKDGILNVMAHDLRSPLAQLSSLFDLVKDEGVNAVQLDYIKKAEDVFRHSFELTDSLVFQGKVDSNSLELKMQTIDLNSFIHQLIDTFIPIANNKGIEINFTTDISPKITSDKFMLKRIIDNLLSNAIKYSMLDSNIWISLVANDDTVELSIKDSGPGFTDVDKNKLYERFTKLSAQPTGNESSSGLGLFIVKTLCDRMNIKINLASKVGQGTTFILTIPVN